MARRAFTDTWIKNLRPHKDARRDFTEAGHPGLMLRVWPAGQKTFVFRFVCPCSTCRSENGGEPRTRVMTLGQYPMLSLDQAHEDHLAARKLLMAGFDPIEERQREAQARELQEAKRAAGAAITIRNVIAEWGWHYARRERKHPREAVRLANVYLGEPWKGRPARDLTKRDAVLLLDGIKKRAPVMATRVYNLGLQIFTFAVARDLLQTNPFLGLLRPGGDEDPRDRKLDEAEIRTFCTALDEPKNGRGGKDVEISQPVRLALKLILVSAQRPGEVAGAARSEFDLTRKVWTIPAERSKNAKPHDVPLSDLAIEIIEALLTLAKDRPHLLPSVHSKLKPDEPLSVRALSRALRNNHKGGKLFGLDPFTPHDLRRTAASGMTALGIQRLHVSKVLNHTDQDITGAVYDQHDYFTEKATALQTWADHVRAVIEGKAAKVVPIRRAAS